MLLIPTGVSFMINSYQVDAEFNFFRLPLKDRCSHEEANIKRQAAPYRQTVKI